MLQSEHTGHSTGSKEDQKEEKSMHSKHWVRGMSEGNRGRNRRFRGRQRSGKSTGTFCLSLSENEF